MASCLSTAFFVNTILQGCHQGTDFGAQRSYFKVTVILSMLIERDIRGMLRDNFFKFAANIHLDLRTIKVYA